jgi:hypothetical protein
MCPPEPQPQNTNEDIFFIASLCPSGRVAVSVGNDIDKHKHVIESYLR